MVNVSFLYLLPSVIIINKEQDQELSIDKSESELKIEIAIESAIKRVNETGIKSFVKFKNDTFDIKNFFSIFLQLFYFSKKEFLLFYPSFFAYRLEALIL